ncbi:hypothetical protein Anas_02156 [Armadillidium nasatum]|uniref:Uncharacterized protein n=1 Tax=Armadillidium nasatum TaxID=96803 RepID=A0A5N5THR8_9CRUS|nr:hypothetical protein Anas_02156 [Armadillidium nasatum]
MGEKEETSILIIGDHHMKRLKEMIVDGIPEANKFSNFSNITWMVSNWATIKSSKKVYFKHRKSTGRPPSVVVLSVGNNDMLKVTKPNCIITNLLRTAKTFYNDGVSVVIICSLVEQESSVGSYNENVKLINRVISSRSHRSEWLHYLLMYNANWFRNHSVYVGNKLLIGLVYDKVAKNLQTKLKSKKIKSLIANDKGNRSIVKKSSNLNFGNGNGSLEENRKNLYQTEVNFLKKRIEKLMSEREKVNSEFVRIDRSIAPLEQFLGILETLNSGPNNQQDNQSDQESQSEYSIGF